MTKLRWIPLLMLLLCSPLVALAAAPGDGSDQYRRGVGQQQHAQLWAAQEQGCLPSMASMRS